MQYKNWIARVGIASIVLAGSLWIGNENVLAQASRDQQSSRVVATLAIIESEGEAQVLSKADLETHGRDVRVLADAWKPATPRTMLGSGDQLKTGPKSSMKLQLNDGTVVTVAGDSSVVIEDIRSARGEAPQTTQIKLEHGKISTKQTSQLLGQTHQIIRTDNGAVNTQLGEIEISKPLQEPEKLVRLASAAGYFPQIAQKPEKDDTFVTLTRGTAVIESFGKGRMITNSLLMPETCIAEDGINFTLTTPKIQVTVTKLEDDSGFRLTAKENFYLLVGTEGTSNKIDIATATSDANIDIEGVEVAEQNANSRSLIRLHPLLTVGVKSSDLIVKLQCDETESRGINEFGIQSLAGDVNVLRTSFGGDTGRPDPSRGLAIEFQPTPGRPTPTPTPVPAGGEFVTPTPAGTDVVIAAAPARIPVTHSFPRNPVIVTGTTTVASVVNSGCPLGADLVNISFNFYNYLPQIMPGTLTFYMTDATWNPYAPNYKTIPAPDVVVSSYVYNNNQQREDGTITFSFCFNPGSFPYFMFFIQDREGNSSQTVRCSGVLAPPGPGGHFSGPLTCN